MGVKIFTSSAVKTKEIVGPSFVRLDPTIENGSSNPSSTVSLMAADDSMTTTSSSPAASNSKGASTSLGIPAGIAGVVLRVLVMVFL